MDLKTKKATAMDDIKWWDYSRCLYEHQSELIDYYYYGGSARWDRRLARGR